MRQRGRVRLDGRWTVQPRCEWSCMRSLGNTPSSTSATVAVADGDSTCGTRAAVYSGLPVRPAPTGAA